MSNYCSSDSTTPAKTAPAENLAETLARELPQASILDMDQVEEQMVFHVAVPKSQDLKTLDMEHLLPNPRRTKATAVLTDVEAFCAYVNRHATAPDTVVWCEFNPQSFALSFTAVFDEHAPDKAGWRSHKATFTPAFSIEWHMWKGNNLQKKTQGDFANFIEQNQPDIAAKEGYPTSLQMLQMATQFEATSEKKFRSVMRLQSGGLRMEYIDDEDKGTQAFMQAFEKFCVGIPVFWAGYAYPIEARLKYSCREGKVTFWYDLIRPDRVHEAAAKAVIEAVRAGIGATPLLMGEVK